MELTQITGCPTRLFMIWKPLNYPMKPSLKHMSFDLCQLLRILQLPGIVKCLLKPQSDILFFMRKTSHLRIPFSNSELNWHLKLAGLIVALKVEELFFTRKKCEKAPTSAAKRQGGDESQPKKELPH